jgi:cobalt-zinc-cadmium efflux system outer membrane protein
MIELLKDCALRAAVLGALVAWHGTASAQTAASGPPVGPSARRTYPLQSVSTPAPGPRMAAVPTMARRASAAEILPSPDSPSQPEPVPPSPLVDQFEFTLDAITQVALANSPVIREAQNQLVAARGRALQAGLYPNPTFGQASPQLAGNQTQYNAYVIQDLVTRGKIGLDAAAAGRAAVEAEFSLIRARFDVLTTVRQRFFTALASQQRAEVLANMVDIARSSRDIGQRLFQLQVGTKSNLLLLQIELSKAEAEQINAVTLAETNRRQLAAATGLPDLPIPRVRGDLTLRLPEYDLLAVQQAVIARNALAQSAQIEIARTQIVLRRAEVEPFPNINMMGGYQNQQPGAFAPQSQGIYQLQLVVPLFNRNQGNIRAAQANIGAAVAQLNRVHNELANAVAAAMGRYLVARQLSVRYESEILPNARDVQSISARLYKEGQTDFLVYLNAQRALLDANLSYISAQEARWLAGAELAGLLQSEQFP